MANAQCLSRGHLLLVIVNVITRVIITLILPSTESETVTEHDDIHPELVRLGVRFL